jgi:hypothetical protein
MNDDLLEQLWLEPLGDSGVWAAGDEGDVAAERVRGRIRIGTLRVHWDGPSGPTHPSVEVRHVIAEADVPDERGEALSHLGPLVDGVRAEYRERWFRCTNCAQLLPPSRRTAASRPPDVEADMCGWCARADRWVEPTY